MEYDVESEKSQLSESDISSIKSGQVSYVLRKHVYDQVRQPLQSQKASISKAF